MGGLETVSRRIFSVLMLNPDVLALVLRAATQCKSLT